MLQGGHLISELKCPPFSLSHFLNWFVLRLPDHGKDIHEKS